MRPLGNTSNTHMQAFLTTQTALTGLPLVLFLAFAATTLLVSLSTCLFLGILVSIAITFFLVGFALLFVVPTVIIASCSATIIFIWGFVGYIILRRFNEGEEPAKLGTRVGDKLHKLTGGRSGYFQGDQTSEESSRDRDVVGGGKSAKGHDGGAGHAYGGVSSSARDGGPVNGVNGTQGTVEWERKWDGVKSEPVVLDTENVFEALKAVSTHTDCAQYTANDK